MWAKIVDMIGNVVVALIMLGIVVMVVWLMIDWTMITNQQRSDRETCIKAGYPDYKWVARQSYCVGIQDGTSIAVPVEEVAPDAP